MAASTVTYELIYTVIIVLNEFFQGITQASFSCLFHGKYKHEFNQLRPKRTDHCLRHINSSSGGKDCDVFFCVMYVKRSSDVLGETSTLSVHFIEIMFFCRPRLQSGSFSSSSLCCIR